MTDLITRLERADGPDRELDWLIECLMDDRARIAGPMHHDPRYTASIDAALTLVPNGWTIALHQQDDGGWFAELREGYCTSYKRVLTSNVHHPHPPLAIALCIAALRAQEKDTNA